MDSKIRTIGDYLYRAAGSSWVVPELRLTVFEDGNEGISQAEIERVHRAIANEICGDAGRMTFEELEFLCDVSDASLSDVARALEVHRSTVTRWRAANSVPPGMSSMAAKRFFWFRIFGDSVRGRSIPLEMAGSDRRFLQFVHDQARRDHLADPISRVAA